MEIMKPNNNKKGCKRKEDCTSIGVAPPLRLPMFRIPENLYNTLKCNLEPPNHLTNLKNYADCIKSLLHTAKVPQNYYLVLFKLILYIEEYGMCQDIQKHNLTNYTIERSGLVDNLFHITLLNLNEDDPFVKIDDSIKIQEVNSANVVNKHEGYICRVVNISQRGIYISVPESFSSNYKKDKTYNVKFRYMSWPMRCCHYAIHLFNKYQLTKIMYPEIKMIPCLQSEIVPQWFNKSVKNNIQQKTAVINILRRIALPAPYLLFGPPGTGKTATLVELICQICEDASKHVLICTPSNAAADEIVKRLLKFNISANDIYRMYAPSKNWQDVNNQITKCANYIDNEVIFLPKDVVMSKKIVITTLITCIRLISLKLRENHFSYIIIDEASQALEPEVFIPLTLISGADEGHIGKVQGQVVIAGDPFQLGPIVKSPMVQHLLGKSVLERLLLECNPYQRDEHGKYNSHYITKLVKNYRSHPAILHVSNKLFYENELEACGGSDVNKALKWSVLPNPKFPIIFHTVHGVEEKSQHSTSTFNTAEVNTVIEYLKKLIGTQFGKYKVQQRDIGIISPYKAQQTKIQEKVKENGWYNLTIGTVEIFQGQEKDVIILTTVRSEKLGFLSNAKRLNVAITRAKALLIIIGNPELLSKDKDWATLVQYCEDNKAVIRCLHCD